MNTGQRIIGLLIVVLAGLSACARNTQPAASDSPRLHFTPNVSHVPISAPAVPYAALAAAQQFADAWIRRDVPRDAWWQTVSHYTTDRYTQQLRGTDPAILPGSTLTGPAMPDAASASSITFSFSTNAGTLHVTAVPAAGTWRIDAAAIDK